MNAKISRKLSIALQFRAKILPFLKERLVKRRLYLQWILFFTAYIFTGNSFTVFISTTYIFTTDISIGNSLQRNAECLGKASVRDF